MDKLSNFDLAMMQTALMNYSLRRDIGEATFKAIEDLVKRINDEIKAREGRAKSDIWS